MIVSCPITRFAMLNKILILALLGFSLVLASPIQDKESDDDKFIDYNVSLNVKPEKEFESSFDWLKKAGDALKNTIKEGTSSVKGALKSFVKSSKNIVKSGTNKFHEMSGNAKEKFDEFQEKLILNTITKLYKVIAFLNKRLIGMGVGKFIEKGMETAEDVSEKVSGLLNKGMDLVGKVHEPVDHKVSEDNVHEAYDEGQKKIDQFKDAVHGTAEKFGHVENLVSEDRQEKTVDNTQNQGHSENSGFSGNSLGENVGGLFNKAKGLLGK